MLSTIRAVVRDGKIELLEPVMLPEGIEVLVTILTEDEHHSGKARARQPFIRSGRMMRMTFMPSFLRSDIFLIRYPLV
jgi:hypothetical protein